MHENLILMVQGGLGKMYEINFFLALTPPSYTLNGLQVNGGMLYRKFTKSLIFRDFDDVLRNPFRYLHIFQLRTLSSKNSENFHA